MGLRLYNTMGRTMQDFVPIKSGHVGFYGCGPTVYNYAHIGNMRAYVFLDILDRTLTYLGYSVNHVMNITDIGHLSGDADEGEDKMVKTARERGQTVLDIARFYTDAFFADIDALNIRRPTTVCKATEHVTDMIELIKRIEANGHTYMAGGNLYYDITTYRDYGKLACLNLDDLKAGARIDIDENKRNPHDFVLWFTKSKFENQALVWDSPWGRGYPGWHIECSAMSMKYLGEQFDIHTGGIDHIPIHHTNEIAQSEGATGKKWVNYWLHNEFLVIAKPKPTEADGNVAANTDDGAEEKMSKSSGDFLTLKKLSDKGYDALDYRFFLLGAHYRSKVAFSWEAMDGAKSARKALVQRVAKIASRADLSQDEVAALTKEASAGGVAQTADTTTQGAGANTDNGAETFGEASINHLTKFRAALEDDLSTPRALSTLQVAVKDGAIDAKELLLLIGKMDGVLGLKLLQSAFDLNAQKDAANAGAAATDNADNANEIQALIDERTNAKKNKDYARADEIRNHLAGLGIILEDTPQGTIWKKR